MNKTERCVGYYLDEKDANPAFRPDSASLEDGSVLKALLDKFDGRRDDKALYAVMLSARLLSVCQKRHERFSDGQGAALSQSFCGI